MIAFWVVVYAFAFVGLVWSMLIVAVMVSAYLSRLEQKRQRRQHVDALINEVGGR